MMRYLAAYLGAGLVVAGMDSIWLILMNQRLYRDALGAILIPGFHLAPAVLFYVIYLVGVVIFAVSPAIRSRRWTTAPLMGALFGLFAYATYDLTNQATLIVWATRVTVVDMAWGCVLSAAGATAGYFASTLVRRA